MSDCLYCKHTEIKTIGVHTLTDFIIFKQVCKKCKKTWKDFKGVDNDHSPILSIQRNTDSDNPK